MRTRYISDINDIGLTEGKWNSIVSKNETNTFFQTYQWFQSYWKVFGDKKELFFISVSDENEIIGFAPLMVSVDDFGKRTLMFIGEGKSDYCDFIINKDKEEVLNRILDTIYIKSKMWDRIYLNNIPESSATLQILRAEKSYVRNTMMATDKIVCPTLIIDGNKTYATKVLNSNSLRRRLNYFNNHGLLVFKNIQNLDDADKYLEKFMEQHIERWSDTKYQSLFLNKKNRDFYMELMRASIDKGWLLFSVLEFDGHPIAFHYGFDYDSKVIWYKPSFDVKYKKHSPGLVLIKYLIEYAINNNKYELDFTIGDESFKSRFTNHKRKNILVEIFKTKSELLINICKYHMRNLLKRAVGWSK